MTRVGGFRNLKEILPDQRSKLVRASLVAKDIFAEVSKREARLWGMARAVRGGEARASHAAVSSAAERLDRTLIQQHLAAPDSAPALRTLASPKLPPPDGARAGRGAAAVPRMTRFRAYAYVWLYQTLWFGDAFGRIPWRYE